MLCPDCRKGEPRSYLLEKENHGWWNWTTAGGLAIVRVLMMTDLSRPEKGGNAEPAFADDMIVLLDATIYQGLI
ncbi:hypothetical protein DL771_010509 [Monosporascus sp. 5C6A]|nr:hypothetical protein DL771_010509 [Monosporascus sp. 5C6A]